MSIYEYSIENLVTCILLPEILPLVYFLQDIHQIPSGIKNNNAVEEKAAVGSQFLHLKIRVMYVTFTNLKEVRRRMK